MSKKELEALAITIDGFRSTLGSILWKMEEEKHLGEWNKSAEDLLKVIKGLENTVKYLRTDTMKSMNLQK